MTTIPPPAEELRILDHELGQLEARRTQLLARRAWLVSVLAQQPAAQPAPFPRPSMPAAAPQGWGARPQAESSPPSVQNVLLVLGGLLLTVAALAFTLVSWGHMGIGGRAAVLGAVTCAALGMPVLLHRRGLGATAEAVAALGLVLTVLDAYALHRVAVPDADGAGYTAVASAALATLWAVYGTALPRLHAPLPAAVVAAQLPLFLGTLAADGGAHALTVALLATAAGDAVLALRVKRTSVRATAGGGAALLWIIALLTATALSWTASGPADAARAAVLLLLAAAIALGAALRVPPAPLSTACAAVAGLAVLLATGGVLRTLAPAAWTVPAHLLCGLALLTVLRTGLPLPVRRGLAGAAAAPVGIALLWALPNVFLAVVGLAPLADDTWAGAPRSVYVDAPLTSGPAVPVTLLALAAALWAAHRLTRADEALRAASVTAAVAAPALAWSALTALPLTIQLPYTAALFTHTALALASVAAATWPARAARPHLATVLLACGLISAASSAVLSLATRPATFTVFALLLAGCAAAAVLHADGARRAVLACAGTLWATALAVAVPAALDLAPHRVALVVLTVPAATALLSARLRGLRVALPLEISGAVAAGLAVALSTGHAPSLALTLALSGVIATATALRPDRRPVSYAAGALFAAACWVRLAAWDVTAPEAYTLPVTLPALVLGHLRRRRDPEASSWPAYGPGLAATLLPSLVAAWSDPHWLRPLLLGTAALALTLLGAHHRLQAPLALGGTVLALVATHELAPYVVQVVGALPRWLPPALAGLLLLGVGATYEQRLRDARRLRDALGRMH
ncbi:SCO7613 C-terminal domain-containing membrane protein [Streptomyces sp. Da 82-17]|uniref:SCO7613 C-terminal domain-containing membrane protein n=1 Tax=Streptomyces sp. Da 82-17 TaxID=3377116 RepID=UPI0038D42F88